MDFSEEYICRLEREKNKAAEKYGDKSVDSLGNLEFDAQDYAIGELVGMDRYAEIIIARAKLYGSRDGVELGERIRRVCRELATELICYRANLISLGIALGKSEYGEGHFLDKGGEKDG